ncbi:MAG: serine--tRNA ligase [Planctomycetota bacterium]|nr:serine--tRNA ligase [Planctomycetota bacterium]MCB9826183.1 serine--tRNA ligase [Planctomycetota bacterium]MCB9902092.1 serine--tRNA ligase [Planctomycetota bacterium]
MLDLAAIRENPDAIREGARRKRIAFDVDRLLALDEDRRRLIRLQEEARAEQKALGRQVKDLQGDAQQLALTRLKVLKDDVLRHTDALAPVQAEIDALLLACPNPPDPDVPDGDDDKANVEVRRHGEPPTFDFEPLDHVELLRRLDGVDIERAGRLAGSRSYVLKGEAAFLEQAVLRLAMDVIRDRGFTLLTVPVVVKEWALRGTAYFPGAEEQTYKIANPTAEDEDSWLVGTSEVSVTALHAGEILDVKDLPLRYAGWSPCFRREAGTYGKDTRGLYRVHQFNKVEQVVIDVADEQKTLDHHAAIVANAEHMLQLLELPYRVMATASGDIGRAATFKYDLEAWMPSRGAYGETHTASRFRDYQARRMDLRYRDEDGRVRHCYTLNNTVIATPRVLIALLEVHQQKDGSIRIPAALRPHLGGREVLEPKS